MADEEIDAEAVASLVKSGLKVVLVLVVIGAALGSTYTVDEGEAAVVTRFGEVQSVEQQGLHFKAPFVDKVTKYNTRVQSTTMTRKEGEGERTGPDQISAPDSDGVQVSFDTTVRWRIDSNRAGLVYERVSRNDRVIEREFVRSDVRRAYRICTQRRTAIEIYTGGMEDMENCVKQEVESRFEPNGLIVTAVNQRAVRLPPEVETRINQKRQLDEQLLIEEKQIEIEEKKAQQRIEEAHGIAESQAIIQETLTSEYLRYLWITEGLEKGDAIYVPIGDDGLPLYKDVDSVRGGEGGSGDSTEEYTQDDFNETRPIDGSVPADG